MKLTKRQIALREADRELNGFLLEWARKHSLEVVEQLSLLSHEVTSLANTLCEYADPERDKDEEET